MIHWRFAEYLKEVLALPAAVYESPSFGYSDGLANLIFPPVGHCSSTTTYYFSSLFSVVLILPAEFLR